MREYPASEIRAIVSDITGIAELGVVSKSLRDGEPHYVVSSRIGDFACTTSGGAWYILKLGIGEKPVQAWSTSAEHVAPGEVQLLQSILSLPSTPIFNSICIDVDTDVRRRTYDSSLGRVLIHSRRAKNGNDIVIETTSHGKFIQLYQHLPSGAIDLGNAHQPLERPF